MSARTYVETFGAGETKRLPAGRYFYIKSATAALSIQTEGNPGSPVLFQGIGSNSEFGPVAEGQGWRFLAVTSAAAQVVEIVISDDGLFKVGNAVTVSGVAQVYVTPSDTMTDTADTTQAAGTETPIAANLLRRRITIGVPTTSQNSVRVSKSGGADDRGIEIQPGTFVAFETRDALYVRNADMFGSAADALWYAEEEI